MLHLQDYDDPIKRIDENHKRNNEAENEETKHVIQLDRLPFDGTSPAESAVISVEQSQDVIIGPVTNFHGNVTILHNPIHTNTLLNDIGTGHEPHHANGARYIGPEATTNPKSSEAPSSEKKIKKYLHTFYILAGLGVLSAGILTVLFFINSSGGVEATYEDKLPFTIPIDPNIPGDFERTPSGHKYVYRNVWGGREPKSIRLLRHPTPLVLITHTAGGQCKSLTTCSSAMQTIQSYHVAKFQSPDIGCNFLIGGDGNIYVGRGWDAINFHDDGMICVSFMGNYVYDTLTDGQIEAAHELLTVGVQKEKLASNYKLISHNQTVPTDSPGMNVYKVISTWDHFANDY